MADLLETEKRDFEKLLGMESGLVIDFSNREFQGFVIDSVSIDIASGAFDTYGTSKAKRLRDFWNKQSNQTVGKLLTDLIEHKKKDSGELVTNSYQELVEQCLAVAVRLENTNNKPQNIEEGKHILPGQQGNEPVKFSNIDKRPFERLLGMETGYVSDFVNDSFQGFIIDSVGVDIFEGEKYASLGTSKANRLRSFWNQESNERNGKLCFDLLQHWKNIKDSTGASITKVEAEQFEKALKVVSTLMSRKPSVPNASENKDSAGETLRPTQEKVPINKPLAVIDQLKKGLEQKKYFSKSRDLVFVSYSRKNKEWVERLKKVLEPSIRRNNFKIWIDESDINPGENWENEIHSALNATKVAVLMLSPDFFASEFIMEVELPSFLQDEREGNITLLPIHITYSDYKNTDIAQYQAVNDPSEPLLKLGEADRDAALVTICEQINQAVLSGAEKS